MIWGARVGPGLNTRAHSAIPLSGCPVTTIVLMQESCSKWAFELFCCRERRESTSNRSFDGCASTHRLHMSCQLRSTRMSLSGWAIREGSTMGDMRMTTLHLYGQVCCWGFLLLVRM